MGIHQTKQVSWDFEEYVSSFLQKLHYELAYSPHTLNAYSKDLLDYREYVKNLELDICSLDALRSWISSLTRKNLSVNSVRRKIATLRSFFSYLHSVGLLQHNPALLLVSPKLDKKVVKFISDSQMFKLLQFSTAEVESIDKNVRLPSNHDLKNSSKIYADVLKNLFVLMFYLTGMRLQELVRLKDWQVDIAGAQIKVIGKGNKMRYIPIADELLVQINYYQSLRDQLFPQTLGDKVFWINPQGRSLNRMYVYRVISRQLKQLSPDGGSPHLLRHTFATHLLNAGADINAIKTLLGHSSLIATQIYTHTHIDKLKLIYAKAHPWSSFASDLKAEDSKKNSS